MTTTEAKDLDKLSRAGLKAFFRIAEKWGLSVKEQMSLLGIDSRTTLNNWKKRTDVRLSRDTLTRLSHILGIYRSLNVIFRDSQFADSWLRRPNKAPLFGGRTALEFLMSGFIDELYRLRQYLDSERGAWA